MKILHTSDWHLGHTLYNYDRSHEQQAFLQHTKDVHGWYARNSQGMSRNDNCGNCRKPRQQF